MRLTSAGPATISAILETHKCFCERTNSSLNKIKLGKIGEPFMTQWPKNYKVLPLCRALITILDDFRSSHGPKEEFTYLDEAIQDFTIIMVLTGDDASLSAPINFESVKVHALLLVRSDIDESINAIRVPLAIAVQFIAKLHAREEAAFPELKPTSVERSLCPKEYVNAPSAPNADEWAGGTLKVAEERGIDNAFETMGAIRRMRAAERGAIYRSLEPEPLASWWRDSRCSAV